MTNHRTYYSGRGLIFDHTGGTLTNLDNGHVSSIKPDVVMNHEIKKQYFANWVKRCLFPIKH